jgi:transcriptional regulator with XRE-family HTH domain
MKLAIKQWRKSRGMTQQVLADKLGKSRSLIAEYEAGTVGVSSLVLYDLAKALEVSVEALYDEEERADDT